MHSAFICIAPQHVLCIAKPKQHSCPEGAPPTLTFTPRPQSCTSKNTNVHKRPLCSGPHAYPKVTRVTVSSQQTTRNYVRRVNERVTYLRRVQSRSGIDRAAAMFYITGISWPVASSSGTYIYINPSDLFNACSRVWLSRSAIYLNYCRTFHTSN